MSATRPLGALLCLATVVVAIAHIYFGYISGGAGAWARGALAFALPVTVGILVVCGLGFWLGWIMATTKEAPPVPKTSEESQAEKAE
ncbi:MAG: hypothetical protein QW495_06570 [Candidatus Hadarchaeum sp.]|uniref:hypothetical protein n=1 Tax=Candidatus Hadarchaeum sp. TaxID=2883567 RepID=UPI0031767AE9